MKGLFSKLFKKSEPIEPQKKIIFNVDSNHTPEKFQHFKDELISFLTDNLLKLDALENEIFQRHEVLKSQRSSPNQSHPDEESLWDDYFERCKAIINPISVSNSNEISRSFGNPSQYHYLLRPNTKMFFIMKSDNRAVIETHFEVGVQKKEQFVIKKIDEIWKIEGKKYNFPDETTWYKDEL